MASRTSSTGVINRGTSGGDSFYVTDVSTLADGGVRTETYRTDGAGKNRKLIRTIDVNKQSKVTKNDFTSNITVEEQRDFLNKRSTFNKLILDQVNSVKSDLEFEVNSNGGNADQIFQIAAGGSGNTSSNAVDEFLGSIGINIDSDNLPLFFEGRRRKEYENLYYPETIATSKQDRIRFSMRYISGSRDIKFDLQKGEGSVGLGKRTTTGINGSVTLPIPGGISDSNNVKFDNDSLDVIGALGFGAALNPKEAVEAGAELLKNALNADDKALREALGGQQGSNLISALRIGLAQAAVGRKGMFSRIGGGILNPNMELLFQAPGMRTFNFSFTMSARSRTEATQIKKIIRFFKQGMSVKRSTNNIFVVSPNTFKVNYILGNTGDDHPSIGRIKECALTDLNTTYGNGSTYMTFDDPDRTMTTYKIDMTFKELNPITEDDYHAESTGPSIDPDEAFKITSGFPADHIGY